MIRVAVAERLLDLMRAAPAFANVAVLDHLPTGGPNDYVPRLWVGLARINGTATYRFVKSGIQPYDDEFDIEVLVEELTPGMGGLAARRNVETAVRALIDLIRADPTLGGVVPGHLSMGFARIEGPNCFPNEEKTGWLSQALVTLPCKARIQ